MSAATAANSGPLSFEEAFSIVKRNEQSQFDRVYATLLAKSDYLTMIPDNDNYSILHLLVMNGCLDLFNKAIAIPNIRFILLTKTATKPGQDVLQISYDNRKKSNTYKKLYETIHRIVQMDKFVDHAKNNNTEECKKMLELDENLANQKPPYRKFYLIHHLAYADNKQAFDELRQLGNFDLKLLTNDQKTASEVAIEQQHSRFAHYIESLSPEMHAIREQHEQERQKQNQAQVKHDEQLEKHIINTSGKNMLDCFTCPLTKDIFQDPVVLCDGFTYERSAIQKWLDLGNRRSPMTNIDLANVELEKLFIKERRMFMAASAALTCEEVYTMVKKGYTGDSSVWDKTYKYIFLHPTDLFRIPSNGRWSIGHQIVYHGNLELFKSLLSIYSEDNPIDIKSTTKDNKTILDIANERKGHHKEQYTYIEHLFVKDKFIQACKAYNWVTIDEMLDKDPTLLNEKPSYCSNYFIHYLVFYGDVRKFAQYNSPDNPFQLDLKNSDGKTALDLLREAKNEPFIDEIQQILSASGRPSDTYRDDRDDDRRSSTHFPTPTNTTSSPPTTLTPQKRKNLICPLTLQIFVDPVLASDGQTYERTAIIEWLRENRNSPQTGELLSDTLVDNIEMKNIIAECRQQKLLP